MAIEGSTTAFPVRGLLEFFARTGRTGRLVVDAPARSGLVALRAGRLVAAGLGAGSQPPRPIAATDLGTLGDLLVDLVSLPGGRFAFHPDVVDGDADGVALTDAFAAAGLDTDRAFDLAAAGGILVRLGEEPVVATVTVPPEQWELLAWVGDGARLDDLAVRLGLGLPTVRRRLDGLVALGLAETGTAETGTAETGTAETGTAETGTGEPATPEPAAA